MPETVIRPIAVDPVAGTLYYSGPGPTAYGAYQSGHYYAATSAASNSTSATLGTGTLRLVPWVVPNSVTLTRIAGEVTSAGDSGSKVRLGVYADSGSGYPGPLLLDAGTIAGDSATVQEVTISLALTPGLYWVGGAVQVVSVTQPTVRITSGTPLFAAYTFGTSLPAANATCAAYQQTSVTGALPSTFTSTVTVTGSAPRVFVKVA